jgi:hypothetical protein
MGTVATAASVPTQTTVPRQEANCSNLPQRWVLTHDRSSLMLRLLLLAPFSYQNDDPGYDCRSRQNSLRPTVLHGMKRRRRNPEDQQECVCDIADLGTSPFESHRVYPIPRCHTTRLEPTIEDIHNIPRVALQPSNNSNARYYKTKSTNALGWCDRTNEAPKRMSHRHPLKPWYCRVG